MAASRKILKPRPILVRDLGQLIESIATGKAGAHELEIDIAGSTSKAVCDRIRRVPRVKGWNALKVEGGTVMGHVLSVTITNTGTTAIPWPTKAASSITNAGPRPAAVGPVKKPAVKKPAVKKPAVKKPAVKKPAVKKPAVKKHGEAPTGRNIGETIKRTTAAKSSK